MKRVNAVGTYMAIFAMYVQFVGPIKAGELEIALRENRKAFVELRNDIVELRLSTAQLRQSVDMLLKVNGDYRAACEEYDQLFSIMSDSTRTLAENVALCLEESVLTRQEAEAILAYANEVNCQAAQLGPALCRLQKAIGWGKALSFLLGLGVGIGIGSAIGAAGAGASASASAGTHAASASPWVASGAATTATATASAGASASMLGPMLGLGIAGGALVGGGMMSQQGGSACYGGVCRQQCVGGVCTPAQRTDGKQFTIIPLFEVEEEQPQEKDQKGKEAVKP